MQAILDHAAANPGATVQFVLVLAAIIVGTACGLLWIAEETKFERRRRRADKRRDKARAKRLAAFRCR